MITQHVPVRWTHLKAMGQSPAHCKLALDGDDDRTTMSRTRGTALHAVVLTTGRCVTKPADAPKRPSSAQKNAKKPSEATVAAIAFWEGFDREHQNDHVVSPAEYEKVMRMADAIRANHIAVEMLIGVREETLFFKHYGRDARATPDVRAHDGAYVTELKSAVTSQPNRFTWQALKYGYHGQMAMQAAAVNAVHGIYPACNIVAVESTKPYPVTCFSLSPRAIEKGERMGRLYMERLISCELSGQWPGYAQTTVDLDAPEDEFELDFGPEPETVAEESSGQ